jgi:hypothetical protein
MSSDQTCACGGAIPADAEWCPRCFSRRPVEAVVPPAGLTHRAFDSTAPAPQPPVRRSATGRFAKTEVSFGLTGRIIGTILLLLPLAGFVYLATQLIGIGGIVVYGGIICPWALRDLWRHPSRG